MPSRRFVLLAGLLLVLNTALWLTPQGLALRQIALPQLFGKSLVRAEIVRKDGSDWRVDRGVITSVDASQVTLHEFDGRDQTIGLTPATHVYGFGRVFPLSALKQGWQVLVTWPANGSADSVKVEKRVVSSGGPPGKGHSG